MDQTSKTKNCSNFAAFFQKDATMGIELQS